MRSALSNPWDGLSKCLHWIIAILIVVESPAGYLMSHTYGLSLRDRQDGLPLHNLLGQIHHTIGFSILFLASIRVIRRFGRAAPRALAAGSSSAARLVQLMLYGLLLALPLSGWAAMSVYREAPLWCFDRSDLVPWLLPRVALSDPHGYGYYAKLHIRLLLIGAGVLTLHVSAALWHHFRRRDDVLLRMWPLATPPNKGPAP